LAANDADPRATCCPANRVFFAPANKSLPLAPDLIGIYFGFFFFLGKEKEKVSPSRNKSPREPTKRYRQKSLNVTQINPKLSLETSCPPLLSESGFTGLKDFQDFFRPC
jgi:hypothetical protein